MISHCRLNPLLSGLLLGSAAVAVASADNERKFVFPELPPSAQKAGYRACEALNSGVCVKGVPYDEYVGKTGVFVNPDKPISQVYRSKIFELKVGGKRLYFSSLSDSDDPLDFASSDLRWYDDVLKEEREKQEFVGRPVVEGSPVLISSVDKVPFERIQVEGVEKPFYRREWSGVQALLRAFPPERHAQILRLLQNAYVEYDDFEQMVRIEPALFQFATEPAIVEIRINWEKQAPRATATIKYTGHDWLFVDHYILLAGEHRFESPIGDFQRDNDTNVWEWRTIPLDDVQERLIEAIIADENAKIRFYGNQYYHDEEFGPVNRRTLRDMLELWKLIGPI